MTAYYNDVENYSCAWLRNLSAMGSIASGQVDGRSIAALAPADVAGAVQFHAFAGIGCWSRALRLAGWPDDVPVWTGSCPCQPFSAAKGRPKKGITDERHLWPEWFRLIRECRPAIIFGEQVASPDGLEWLDVVSTDLEREGYAIGAADLCAASAGAPHIRQRLYFTAVDGDRGRATLARGLGNASLDGDRKHPRELSRDEKEYEKRAEDSDHAPIPASATSGFWSPADWLPCSDGKSRPVEPGTFPLAHGVTDRVATLRAYGNAIVAPVAASFIRAVIETEGK